MLRIVMLGAGSGFTHNLSGDIMQLEGIEGGELCLVDVDAKRLRLAEIPIEAIYTEYSLSKGQSFAVGVQTALKLILRRLLD